MACAWYGLCHNNCINGVDVYDNDNGEDHIFCWEDLLLQGNFIDDMGPAERILMAYACLFFYFGGLVPEHVRIKVYSFSHKFWSDVHPLELFSTFNFEIYWI